MHAHVIDELAASAWMDAYRAAWLARDPDAIGRLFAADAFYQERRYTPALRGADAIRDYWRTAVATEQRNVSFDYTVVVLRGFTACVHWHASVELPPGEAVTELDALSRIAFSVDRSPAGLLVAYAWDEWIDRRDVEMTKAAPRRPLPAL